MKDGEVRDFGRRDKIGYMFGDFGNDFTFIFASSFLMVFYTKVLGISGGMVGTLFLVARFVDAFTDVTMGRIVDAAPPARDGKFRCWIRRMCGPVALSSFLMYQTAMAQASMPWKIVYMYVTYLLWGSIFYTSINRFSVLVRWHLRSRRRHRSGNGVIYLPVDWGDTGGACDRHRDAAFSVHDQCRRQSGRARRRNIYGGCGHFLDSRVTLLSGLLPHDYGAGGGGA